MHRDLVEEKLGKTISEYAEKIAKKVISESVKQTETEELELAVDVKILPPSTGECGFANKNDKNGLFPCSQFKILVYGESDHEPVMHVVGFGWDVVFYYENGDLYGIVSAGTNIDVFNYMKNNITEWLKQKSTLYKKASNRDVIHSGWSSFN